MTHVLRLSVFCACVALVAACGGDTTVASATCLDGEKNGAETDVDCGGTCPKCDTGKGCSYATDCTSSVCAAGACAASTCSDGVKNGAEAGIDCGGSCGGCPQGCADGTKNGDETGVDCGGSCAPCAASCTDGVKNGSETGVDCGGSCAPCAANCTDGVKNGNETGVDCGGSCPACPTSGCTSGGQCPSGVCGPNGQCAAPACADRVRNGAETDVDCGGPSCPKCANGKECDAPRDCSSGICSAAGNCEAQPTASCTDRIRNGAETDVDCGGPACGPCAVGLVCSLPGDCVTESCVQGRCASPLCTADLVAQGTPCTPCSANSACAAAYGTPGAPYFCLDGTCTPGDCATTADCPSGKTCGIAAPNLCGKCTSDAQCLAAAGPGQICDTARGACVSASCSLPDATRCVNPADVCCSGSCVPGSCCSSADCAGSGAGAICSNHVCTTCDAPSGNVYRVDPDQGSDTTATGSGRGGGQPSPSCAFATITRALAAIGANPPQGTRILVKGGSTTGGLETLPIRIPAGVSIEGEGATPAKLVVGSGLEGFVMAASNVALKNFVVEGKNQLGWGGLKVTSGASNASISGVTIQKFLRAGIAVSGGSLAIGPGTIVQDNGTSTSKYSGIRISGDGRVTLRANAGEPQILVTRNTFNGIEVSTGGSVEIHGVPSADGSTGTVVVSANGSNGLYILQSPDRANLPQNLIDGLVAREHASSSGTGIHLYGGGNVKVRNSVAIANNRHGIWISAGGTGPNAFDVSKLDLGKPGDPGRNRLQVLAGAGTPNNGAGLCFQLGTGATSRLSAVGNLFGGLDCSASSGGTVRKRSTCGTAIDLGISFATTSVDVASCTY